MSDEMHQETDRLIDEVRLALESGGDARATALDLAGAINAGLVQDLAARYLVDQATERIRRATLRAERAALRSRLSAEERRAARTMPSMDEISTNMFAALDKYTAAMQIDWTRELLDSTFAMADGTRVRWGGATVEQHRERLGLFMAQAENSIEGAARHSLAIRELEQTGAACLDEMAGVAA